MSAASVPAARDPETKQLRRTEVISDDKRICLPARVSGGLSGAGAITFPDAIETARLYSEQLDSSGADGTLDRSNHEVSMLSGG
jgi:hypothetical protein